MSLLKVFSDPFHLPQLRATVWFCAACVKRQRAATFEVAYSSEVMCHSSLKQGRTIFSVICAVLMHLWVERTNMYNCS